MQHVSTYNNHLQAMLRIVIALQVGCAHLGSNMAYSAFAAFFNIYYAIISRVKCVVCATHLTLLIRA